jgi:outer membrane immunogenic protein
MRKFVGTIVVLSAIACTSPAWAVVNVDVVVPQSSESQETGSQTIALVQTDQGHTVAVPGHKTSDGHVVFPVPDSVAHHATTVVVEKTEKGKKKEESAALPWETFKQGGYIALVAIGTTAPSGSSGFYVGANVGGAWGRGSYTDGMASTSPGSFDTSGAFGGATAGFNMSWGFGLGWGVEAQINGGNLRGSTTNDCGVGCGTRVDFFTTITPRMSYSFAPNLDFFAKGGLAFGEVKAQIGGLPGLTSLRTGWAAGGGIEWAVLPGWTASVEYDHIDLGSFHCTVDGCGGTEKVSTYFDTVMLGVDYHFNQQWTIPSDVRLKRDIVPVGRLANGLHLYRFHYAWSDQLYVGVMAQEVQQVMPEAVVPGPYGYLAVDYGKVGTELKTWDEFVASNPVPVDLPE